jgi:hypothetical protein
MNPFIASNVNLSGHYADIIVIPYYVYSASREYNWYIVKYHDNIVESGPSFLIVQYTDKDGNFEWQIVTNSPIQNRQDLLEDASKFIDDFYGNAGIQAVN